MTIAIFTFGYSHLHPNGYIKIHAKDSETARDKMIEMCGYQWAMQYSASKEDHLINIGLKLIQEIKVLDVD